jgi:phosphate/phosphite/phosphonate ABC transporter binding protein
LRIAVAAVISPQGTTLSYSPLLEYLGQRLEQPVTLVQRQTYAEVNDLIRTGEVDLAFICTGAYVQGGTELGAELLAAPQVGGETVYYSYIIVSADSDIQSIADFRGRSFAFTDPLSNTGKLSAVHLLWQQGETPESYFAETIYTFSHDNSIRAVADGLVDGAAVDSLVYDYLIQREPDLSNQIRVVETSVPYGIPPVVIPATADEALKDQARQALLTLHQDATGKAILETLGIDRFVSVDDAAYDSVREMLADLEQIP